MKARNFQQPPMLGLFFVAHLFGKSSDAFNVVVPSAVRNGINREQNQHLYATRLFSSSSSSSSGGDDVNSEFELEDWRKFRASLIAKEAAEDDDESSNSTKTEKEMKRKSVSEENERLLEEQNSELAKEYKSEVWAHLIAEPEVGGLICRMPIEGELYWGTGYWKEKLDTLLSIDTMGPPDSQMDHWFQLAERMLVREVEAITANVGKNGMLNPNDLQEDSRELLERYLDYRQTWQEVCLMLGSTQGVVINRPITQNINKPLAKLLLEGQPTASMASTSSISDKAEDGLPFGFIDQFLEAFGNGAVYMGGPDLQAEPALLVHGIDQLEGASELAPGTRIYIGGLKAAVEGVLEGKYQPLDFRFFLGRKVFDDAGGSLKEKIDQASYRAMACNRSLALKQCLGLPKPLWHEGT